MLLCEKNVVEFELCKGPIYVATTIIQRWYFSSKLEKDYSSCLKYSCFQLSTSTRTISATCRSFVYIKMSRMTKLIILKF